MACDVTQLSTHFESNGNPAAIGYDVNGSYSYGLYQLASKPGAMKAFLDFLVQPFPALSSTLTAAGGAAAALVGSSTFKQAWRSLAAPATLTAFVAAQNQFAVHSYYTPSIQRLQRVNIDLSTRACAIGNTIFSLSIMAGSGVAIANGSGACGLIFDAVQRLGGVPALPELTDLALLTQIYDCKIERIDKRREYARVSDGIRESVRNRILNERHQALRLLGVSNQPDK